MEECSDTLETPKPPWRERKQAYLAHLAHASPEALRVSLADKVHNARAIQRDFAALGDALWMRFDAPRDDLLWYYRALAEVFERRRPGPLARELVQTLTALEGDVRRARSE